MTTQMKSHTSIPFDPVSVIEFFNNFELTFDTGAVYEGTNMWLLHFIMNKTSSAVLNAQQRD